MRRCRLGAIDVREGDEEPVPNSKNQAAEVHNAPTGGANLNSGAQGGQKAGKPECWLATEEVGKAPREDGREERAEGEKRADQLLKCCLVKS